MAEHADAAPEDIRQDAGETDRNARPRPPAFPAVVKVRMIAMIIIGAVTFIYGTMVIRNFGKALLPFVAFGPLRPVVENIREAEATAAGQTFRVINNYRITFSNGWVEDPLTWKYQLFGMVCELAANAVFLFLVGQGLRWLVRAWSGFDIFGGVGDADELPAILKAMRQKDNNVRPSPVLLLPLALAGFLFFRYGNFCMSLAADIFELLRPVPADVAAGGADSWEYGAIIRFSDGHVASVGHRDGKSFDSFLLVAFLAFIVLPTLFCLCPAWFGRLPRRFGTSGEALWRAIDLPGRFGRLNAWFLAPDNGRSKIRAAGWALGVVYGYYYFAAAGDAYIRFLFPTLELGWDEAVGEGVRLAANSGGLLVFTNGQTARADTWRHGVPIIAAFAIMFAALTWGVSRLVQWLLAAADARKRRLRWKIFEEGEARGPEEYTAMIAERLDPKREEYFLYALMPPLLAIIVATILAWAVMALAVNPFFPAHLYAKTARMDGGELGAAVNLLWQYPLYKIMDYGVWIGLIALLLNLFKPLSGRVRREMAESRRSRD